MLATAWFSRWANHFRNATNRIWKYDWAPTGSRSSTRKSWRMVVVVLDPFLQPYHLIAATIYAKNTVSQLTPRQLASIFASVTSSPPQNTQEAESSFKHVDNGDGSTRSICLTCGESVAVSALPQELQDGEIQHECAGSPF